MTRNIGNTIAFYAKYLPLKRTKLLIDIVNKQQKLIAELLSKEPSPTIDELRELLLPKITRIIPGKRKNET